MPMSEESVLRVLAIAQLLFLLTTGVWFVLGAHRQNQMPRPLPLAGGACLGALAVVACGLITNLLTTAPLTPGLVVVAVGLAPFTTVTLCAVVQASRRT